MKLLDFDYDEGRNIVTFEMKNSEISAICNQLEFLVLLNAKSEDKKTIQEFHDFLLEVISAF